MKELKDKFYKNCLFLVQNFKDASERDIEQQVKDVSNMPIFKDIDLALARVSIFCVPLVTVKGPSVELAAVSFGKSLRLSVILASPV